MKINETSTFEAPKNETAAHYDWRTPIGCKVISGQGTPTVEISSSFLSQDSPVRLIRTFTDEHKDTLETPIKFCRYVQSIQDHTIAPGEKITPKLTFTTHRPKVKTPVDKSWHTG